MKLPRSIYPPLNMHFIVEFDEKYFSMNAHFQSVQGPKARICRDEVNKKEHIQFENLILRRAYQPDSKMVKWCVNRIK